MYFLHLSNQDIGASAITSAFNWFPFQCSKINKYEDLFFQCSLCHIINLLLPKLVRSRWLGIGLVLFLGFYGPRLRLGPQNAKRELGQYPAILTSRLVNNIYICYISFSNLTLSIPIVIVMQIMLIAVVVVFDQQSVTKKMVWTQE